MTWNYQNLAVAIQLFKSVKPPFSLLRHNLLQDGKKTTDAAISFGNITLVDQDLIKKMVAESIKAWELRNQEESNALKMELLEVKASQEFICVKYEDLKINYEKLQKINKKQAGEIEKLQTQSTNLEIREAKGEGKIDENEQYDRRQNLEIAEIPSKTGENTNKIVQEVAKLMKINLSEDQISTSHRLPVSQRSKWDNTESKKRQKASSPPIIVRFLSREVRNSLYSNRKLLREANLKKFFVQGTTEIYLNENLTRIRKNLLWKAKQRAKANGYQYVWTNNGRINVRLSKDNEVIIISNEKDLDLIKSN